MLFTTTRIETPKIYDKVTAANMTVDDHHRIGRSLCAMVAMIDERLAGSYSALCREELVVRVNVARILAQAAAWHAQEAVAKATPEVVDLREPEYV